MKKIDWLDPKAKISEHFTVREALWLPRYGRLASDDALTNDIKKNIVDISMKLEKIRDLFGSKSIIIHSWFRPKKYNALIGGAKKSQHLLGKAVDFHVEGFSCRYIKTWLKCWLNRLDLRMEDNGAGNWIHIDIKKLNRFFKP